MSVVSGQARRRWAAVAVGVAVLVSLPAAASAAGGWLAGRGVSSVPAPAEVVRRARASSAVPYSGLVESRGNLGLPDLPQIGDVPAQLGGTTRTRVWWSGERDWRVDVAATTGEQGVYRVAGRTSLWDYERNRLTLVGGDPSVRLPRADDLQPPQLARRVLGGLGGGDRVEPIGGTDPEVRSIAGTRASGVRIVPGDPRSTIGRLDVWVDAAHGLPVAVDVIDAKGVVALESHFLDLRFGAPAASALALPPAPGATRDADPAPDLAARIQRYAPGRLPTTLAGVASSEPIVGGTATYGSGLVRFAVLPVPRRLSSQVDEATRNGGAAVTDVNGGEVLTVTSSVVNLVVARRAADGRSFILAGLVRPQLLALAAEQLVSGP